jgi:hypothetical protein
VVVAVALWVRDLFSTRAVRAGASPPRVSAPARPVSAPLVPYDRERRLP